MIKILNIMFFLSVLILFNPESMAETKPDCSQYSTKTFSGLSDKIRCKNGLPPKKNIFNLFKLKSKSAINNNENLQDREIACNEYSTKTITGLIGKLRCNK